MTHENTNRTEITELQNMLRVIAQADGNLPLLNADGIFGEKTEEAVIAFQTLAGLTPNGMVDRETWDAIFRTYQNANRLISLQQIQPFPSGDYKIRSGERSDTILFIQLMLSAIALSLNIFDDIEYTGTYDEKTEKAVTEFQKLHSLPSDGVIDGNTWNKLATQYNAISENPLYTR